MIREIDARTAPDADLVAMWEVEHASLLPGEPGRTRDEAVAFWRNQPTTHESFDWVAGGGFASLYVHGPKAVFLHLRVRPDARRAGLGTTLARAAIARARERGAAEVHAHYATDEGRSFAARFDARDGQREVASVLRFDGELPEPVTPDGWRVLTWLGRVPDEQLDAFVVARAAMDDAPGSDEIGFPTASAERVRASEASLVARNREMRLTVAMRDDGVIGAFTELRISEGSTVALTDDTATVAAHRGLGLAKAIKVESLRRLRADHPEVEAVTTMNAEENAAMRHINESVGFRPVATWTTATVALARVGGRER